MNSLSDAEAAAARALIDLALHEDLGSEGDLTTLALIPPENEGRAAFVVRSPGVIAGWPVAQLVLHRIDPSIHIEIGIGDGTSAQRGDVVATVSGRMQSILTAERVALNFLQRLSGVATLTRRYVDLVTGTRAAILDTRKTTPGWRLLEKYAVRQGGGTNHRIGLFDGILIKDNHLAAMAGNIEHAIARARAAVGTTLPIELEVDTLQQFDQGLAAAPSIILLDNMTLEQMRECVARRNQRAPGIGLEASGGVKQSTVRAIAETGVDRISVGALTHSAPALDIALDYSM